MKTYLNLVAGTVDCLQNVSIKCDVKCLIFLILFVDVSKCQQCGRTVVDEFKDGTEAKRRIGCDSNGKKLGNLFILAWY